MTNGVDVNIGADTREFASSVRNGMQEPVEDAQGALDDYVKAGDAAGDQLTDTFRQQQRQTTELKGDIEQLNRTIRDSSGPAYRKAGQDVDTFRHRSTEGFDEIRESARSNAIEVGASFTGGLDQAVGGLQGFVAEFLAGFGPAGIIAGVGAAALLGTVSQAIANGQEAAEAQKQAVASLANEYIEAGRTGKRSFDDTAAAIQAMATSDGSDVVITLQQAWEAASTAGADYQGIVQGIASSSPQEIAKARRALDELGDSQRKNIKGAQDYANDPNASLTPKLRAVAQLDDALQRAEKQEKEAARAADLAAKAGLSDYARRRDLIKQLADGFDDAASNVDDFIDKQGRFNPRKFIKHMEDVRTELVNYKRDLAKADLGPEAEKFLESQGAQTAAAMLRGYKQATPTQQAQLREIWSTAGDENADSYESALGKNIGKIKVKPPTIPKSVVPTPDSSRLDAYLRTPAVKRIVLEGVTRDGKRVF